MEFVLENPLACNEEDFISDLFSAESDHMSSFPTNPKQSLRQIALSIIFQFQFAWNFDPFLIYLSANYADRFLSKSEISSEKPWILRLLAISCISLASKMMKIEFCVTDLQKGEEYLFNARTIHRMEMIVLNALQWRMRSITPFCFVNYFLNFFKPNQTPYLRELKNRATETLFKAQNQVKILEHKPSLIAASALLSAANELFPIQFSSFRSAIADSLFVNKERLEECLKLIEEVVMDGYDSTIEIISSSETPVTVLCNVESDVTVGLNSDERDLKKRRTLCG